MPSTQKKIILNVGYVGLLPSIKALSPCISKDLIPKDQKYFSRIIKSKYFKNSFVNSKTDNSNGFVGSLLDSTHLTTRITLQIADIGTAAMDSLIERINYRIDSIINPEQLLYHKAVKEATVDKFYSSNQIVRYRVKQILTNGDLALNNEFPKRNSAIEKLYGKQQFSDAVKQSVGSLKVKSDITGSGVLFTKGTTYMIKNLIISLILAIMVIAIIMALLFKSIKMVLVSLLPNLLPLIFTSALMGYFGISIKPSTILVFSIAFGISVDNTIHFLAKYRQELFDSNWKIQPSVYAALKERGVSMFYSSVVSICHPNSAFAASKYH